MTPRTAARRVILSETSRPTVSRDVARRIGVSRQNLNLWRTHGVRGLPARTTFDGIATVIGQTYLVVLQAALRDAGYLDDGDLR